MLKQVSRYVVVQLIAYGIDFLAFALLHTIGQLEPVAANVVGKCVAGLVAFVLHRRYTFEAGAGSLRSQAWRYGVVLAAHIPLASLGLAVLLRLEMPPVAAKVVADIGIVGLTFLLSRALVFNVPRNE